jgi:ribonuclease P protein component
VGIIVPKHGRRIVDRNRLKRRLREILRQEMLPWLSGRGSAMDVLVRARREAYTATYDELRQELIAWQSRR